ncbi:hypothetical protein ZWY2020_022731 [Hordeum vulgare]|nr:hypothetical protein ZWY2020_022731 [Hordeum vulgare]
MACLAAAPASFAPFFCREPFPSPANLYQPPTSIASLTASSPPFYPSRVMVRWEAPPAGWLKLNFDGSVYNDGSGRASVGGAIRDCTGRVLVAFAEPTEHSTVGIVEARALIRGLRLALTRFRGRLVAEGDDLMLVQLLTGEETQTRIPMAMQKEILMLLGCFAACKVQHIFREGNQVAHVLCKEAYERPGVWAGGILPHAVWDKAQDDVHGVAHERLCKKKML